jgi:hypothetical protein
LFDQEWSERLPIFVFAIEREEGVPHTEHVLPRAFSAARMWRVSLAIQRDGADFV